MEVEPAAIGDADQVKPRGFNCNGVSQRLVEILDAEGGKDQTAGAIHSEAQAVTPGRPFEKSLSTPMMLLQLAQISNENDGVGPLKLKRPMRNWWQSRTAGLFGSKPAAVSESQPTSIRAGRE